jgi:hypothetical protein
MVAEVGQGLARAGRGGDGGDDGKGGNGGEVGLTAIAPKNQTPKPKNKGVDRC